MGVDSTRLNTNYLRADVNPATHAGLGATFVQPLLRGFGLAVDNRYIRIAMNNRSVSDLVFEQQVVSTAYEHQSYGRKCTPQSYSGSNAPSSAGDGPEGLPDPRECRFSGVVCSSYYSDGHDDLAGTRAG